MVLPVILLFLGGVIEVSRLLMLQHSADTAAYEGARCAMVPGASAAEARQAALELLAAANLKSATVTVMPDPLIESTSLITVTVDLPVRDNTGCLRFGSRAGTYSPPSRLSRNGRQLYSLPACPS